MDASTQAPTSQSQAPSFTFLGSMHEGIPVGHANLDACIKFYTEVLAFTVKPRGCRRTW